MTEPGPGALRLSALHVYPIKSAAGLAPAEWEVDHFGLRHDRRWMVVDAAGRMLSQRTHPRLALVRPSVGPGILRVETAGMPVLELPLAPAAVVTTSATVWDDTCAAVWTGERAARWFSDVLDADCNLVYMPETTLRPASTDYAPVGHRVSFADAFPFLVVSEESLADLNARMLAPLPMNRFRPNLVIAGGMPYVEDGLATFRIGELRFRGVKPCDRCVVTTTDQATGERGLEPLRTLATYRRRDGKVLFGQNVVHEGTGALAVGAAIQR
jgi:MOSC domain-containing protein